MKDLIYAVLWAIALSAIRKADTLPFWADLFVTAVGFLMIVCVTLLGRRDEIPEGEAS